MLLALVVQPAASWHAVPTNIIHLSEAAPRRVAANIISWACVYFVSSFISPLPWTAAAQAMETSCAIDDALAPEENFLYNTVLHLGSQEQLDTASSKIIAGWVYGEITVAVCLPNFSIRLPGMLVSRVEKGL